MILALAVGRKGDLRAIDLVLDMHESLGMVFLMGTKVRWVGWDEGGRNMLECVGMEWIEMG